MVLQLAPLRLQANSLPTTPGVYFWRDEAGQILYIGKAVNLRSRVISYFSTARKDRRTRQLIEASATITYEETGSELEALFRESALIKREQPPFNRQLRQPRRLHYLKFDVRHPDPYMEIARETEDDGSLYFGPFPSGAIARETMTFLHAVLPLRKCAAAKPRCRPCIYLQMGTCAAPLLDVEHRRRHIEAIERLHDLLDGRTDRVMEWLVTKRDRLSTSLLYEQAAEVQQRIDALLDHRRHHAILEAAIACRCVLIHDDARPAARLLLVAHGHVLSTRDASGLTTDQIAAWIRAHEPLIAVARYEQNELDAASVLERWLHCNRTETRWVAIPHSCAHADLQERVGYVTGSKTEPGKSRAVTIAR